MAARLICFDELVLVFRQDAGKDRGLLRVNGPVGRTALTLACSNKCDGLAVSRIGLLRTISSAVPCAITKKLSAFTAVSY